MGKKWEKLPSFMAECFEVFEVRCPVCGNKVTYIGKTHAPSHCFICDTELEIEKENET